MLLTPDVLPSPQTACNGARVAAMSGEALPSAPGGFGPRAPRITFVLPGRGRSGGVRVTVEMANRLGARGRATRVAYRQPPFFSSAGMRSAAKSFWLRLRGYQHADWIRECRAEAVGFRRLASLDFENGEIVIAVGTMTVHEVNALKANVVKVRYCHGFSEDQPELTRAAYRIPMPTIVVSSTLLPRLAELTGSQGAKVVPNGVDTAQYYPDAFPRDGVGTVYSSHRLKAPRDILEILRRVRRQRPSVPLYVFGEERRPSGLPRGAYWRLPSVEKARELYSRSKVWILASRSEGLPGPVLEAMACGCAVVSTIQPGSLEIVRQGENGLLVDVGDTDAFLREILRLLDDETARGRIAAEALRTAQRFSWDNAANQMEAFLRTLVSEPAELVNRAARVMPQREKTRI